MTSVLLVGEDNPLSLEPEHALHNYPPNCAGWRLQRILGLSDDDYLGLDRTNLCTPTWSTFEARARAKLLMGAALRHDAMVLLGRKVAEAFARVLDPRPRLEPFTRHDLRIEAGEVARLTLVALPHPSGRNHLWNDPANRLRAQALLRDAAPGVAWGTWAPP